MSMETGSPSVPLKLITLSTPPHPLVEIIFVHDLHGGSRKIWSGIEALDQLWSKKRLARDPDLQHARFHSFGYSSDRIDRGDTSIHQVAEVLLSDLYDYRMISENLDLSIVFVAQEIGCLIVKNACVMAHRKTDFQNTAQHIHSMFFLDTSHGNLNETHAGDSQPTPITSSSIEREFRPYSEEFESFFGKRIVMDMNHKNICDFNNPTDPYFVQFRDLLCETIGSIVQDVSDRPSARELRDLQECLDIREKPNDLFEFGDVALPDSASWFLEQTYFTEWRDGPTHEEHIPSSPSLPETFKILWTTAMPGSGKSVLASQVVKHLESLNLDCCYYFFSLEEHSKSTISGLLRSIAYQMALLHPHVRKKLLQLKMTGMQLARNEGKLIWHTLFASGIFTCHTARPQYWIIDALDECREFDSLISMLGKLDANFPLRIFLTSRPLPKIRSHMGALGSKVWEYTFGFEDIRHNIKRFIEDRSNSYLLPRDSREHSQNLIETILEKSEGCFLWVSLVMEELEHTYTINDVTRVLDVVPPGMNRLYMRSLAQVLDLRREQYELSKAILSVVVCAMRPLTVEELSNALEFHLRLKLLSHSIESSCGNLIYIDKHGRVCFVHRTAREYLLEHGLSEIFQTNLTSAHHSLGMICLKYLKETQMKWTATSSRSRSSILHIAHRESLSAFAQYACFHFSDHIMRGNPHDNAILNDLYTFVITNSLGWIEHVAIHDHIPVLVRTAQDIRTFLGRRAKYTPLIDEKSQCLQRWAEDLVRIAARFGKNLVSLPQSIYGLIPPLLPSESIIAAQHNGRRGIEIVGISNKSWDDRLCGISIHGKTASSLACAATTFAVGLRNGAICIYDYVTFRELRWVQHEEAVNMLRYSHSGASLVSAGRKHIRLFNVFTGCEVWNGETVAAPLDVAFTETDRELIVIMKNNTLEIRDAIDGRISNSIVQLHSHGRPITCASIDDETAMLAIAVRRQPLILFDLGSEEVLGPCERPTSDAEDSDFAESVTALQFCHNTGTSLLAVVYLGGSLMTFDAEAQSALCKITHHTDIVTIACSPDGRTLAVGDRSGVIALYETETLKLLHTITHKSDSAIWTVAFAADSTRLLDIRGDQCNVWEPLALMRTEPPDSDSMFDEEPIYDRSTQADEDLFDNTAIAVETSGELIVCGTDNGSVNLHETSTGRKVQLLYKHLYGSRISQICVGTEYIASVGSFDELVVKRYHSSAVWTCEDILHERYLEPIRQILLAPNDSRLLVVFGNSVVLHELSKQQSERSFTRETDEVWASHPEKPERLFAVRRNTITQHSWADLASSSVLSTTEIPWADENSMKVQHVASLMECRKLAIVCSQQNHRSTSVCVTLLDCSSPPTTRTDSDCQFSIKTTDIAILKGVKHIIGNKNNSLYFLDEDLWICSIALGTDTVKYARHMFIPDQWVEANSQPLLLLTSKGEILLAKKNEIAIIKRPFTYSTTTTESVLDDRSDNETKLLESELEHPQLASIPEVKAFVPNTADFSSVANSPCDIDVPKPTVPATLPKPDAKFRPMPRSLLQIICRSIRRATRPPVRFGYHRIEWTCTCGKHMYRDFEKSTAMLEHFPHYPYRSAVQNDDAVVNRNAADLTPDASCLSASPNRVNEGSNSSRKNGKASSVDNISHVHDPQQVRAEPICIRRFFELCVNTGRYTITLGELDGSEVRTDQELFASIVEKYYKLRTPRLQRMFMKPVDVHFVFFILKQSHRVAIRDGPVVLPPQEELDNKRYEYTCSWPPPMDRREFLHYFQEYANGHQDAAYFYRFPKRLGLPLCNPQSAEDYGWGIHIIEGPNRVILTWCCVIVLTISFAVSVIYSIAMKTQEQGFGIGSWMVAVLTTMLAALYFQFEED